MKRLLTVAAMAGGLLLLFGGPAHASHSIGLGQCDQGSSACGGAAEGSTTSGNGDCATATPQSSPPNGTTNEVGVAGSGGRVSAADFAGLYAAAFAGTHCDSAGHRSIEVVAAQYAVPGTGIGFGVPNWVVAGWGSWNGGCVSGVQVQAMYQDIGCPAGPPPTVGAVLP